MSELRVVPVKDRDGSIIAYVVGCSPSALALPLAIDLALPEGPMDAYGNITRHVMDSRDAVITLLREAGLTVIPYSRIECAAHTEDCQL